MNRLLPTTLVGSYAQPDWLIDREKLAGPLSAARAREGAVARRAGIPRSRRRTTRRCWRSATQERAGLDIITDGEMRRESYSNRFATALEGVDIDNPGTALDRSGHPNPVPRVTGKVRRKHPVEVRDVKFLRAQHRPHDQDDGARPVHDVAAGAERLLHRTRRRWRSTTRPPSTPRSRTCSRPAPTWCRSTSPTCRRGPRRRGSTA